MLRDKFTQIWQKLTDLQFVFSYFYVFEVVEHNRDSFRGITLKK
jgi:hypothetical protein